MNKFFGLVAAMFTSLFFVSCVHLMGENTGTQPQQPLVPVSSDSLFLKETLAKAILPTNTLEPLVWGGEWGIDSSEKVFPGKRDTLQECRDVFINPEKGDTALVEFPTRANKRNLGMRGPGPSSVQVSSTSWYFPGYSDTLIDSVYWYSYVSYKPIYQDREIYHKNLGKTLDEPLKNPGKIYTIDSYQFVSDINRGIHIYNVKNPKSPEHLAFIYIPGTLDIAIKNNTLYTNSYNNLVTFDITQPKTPQLLNVLEKAFPEVHRMGFPVISEKGGLLVAWQVDTVYSCYRWDGRYYLEARFDVESLDSSSQQSKPKTDKIGKAGSMSRFMVTSEALYAVDQSNLRVFDISAEAKPKKGAVLDVGWGLETLFYRDRESDNPDIQPALFIGSTTGMYIYTVNSALNPLFASKYEHFTSCDPVVVQDTLAFVTLRSGAFCRQGINVLEVISIANLTAPTLLKTYNLQNPHGLAVQDSLIYVCEGEYGFKILSLKQTMEVEILSHTQGFHAYDLILEGTRLTLLGNSGVYIYDVSDPRKPVLLSIRTAPNKDKIIIM